jgi:outer membrane biosynthesis protein TonB
LEAHLGTVTIAVKITVGTGGTVTSVAPSFVRVSFPTRYKDDFDQAIQTALSQWRFEPAQLARLDPQVAEAPVVVSTETMETSFDVVFTFVASGTSAANFLKSMKE